MVYDFTLIKITKHPKDGTSVIDFRELYRAYPDLDALSSPPKEAPEGTKPLFPPEAFEKEFERLSAMPFSDEVADKIRETAKRGFARVLTGEVTHFAVFSTVRSRFNRTQRAQAAQHARFKQHVLADQRRLLRARPTIISESELKQYHTELLERHKAGLLEVRTLDGRLLDLETFKIAPAAPVENPRPSPILDSVANDIPTGIPFPKLPGGTVLSSEQVRQVVDGMADVDGELKIDPKDGTAVVLPPNVDPPEEELAVLQEAAPEGEGEELEEETEEEIEELPPGVPPPPPPPGGMPQRHNKKKKNRR